MVSIKLNFVQVKNVHDSYDSLHQLYRWSTLFKIYREVNVT